MTGRDGVRNYVNFGTLDKSETTFGTMLKDVDTRRRSRASGNCTLLLMDRCRKTLGSMPIVFGISQGLGASVIGIRV